MNKINKLPILLVIAIVLGLIIGWIDSRPNWDDTGTTVAALIIVSASLGFFQSKRAWLLAIAAGIWVPFFNFVSHQYFNSLPAIIFAFAGAYLGVLIKKIFSVRIS